MTQTVILGSGHPSTREFYSTIGREPSQSMPDPVVHISPQHMPDLDRLQQVLSQARDVYWADCGGQGFDDRDCYHEFLEWLKHYQLRHGNVRNFESISPDPFGWASDDIHLVDQPSVIFLGGSTTAGGPWLDSAYSYTTLLCHQLQRHEINLATRYHTQSLDKIFEIFLRVRWQAGAMAVLHVPPMFRICHCDQNHVLHDFSLGNPPTHKLGVETVMALIETHTQQNLFYHALQKIQAMISIAKANGVRLVFWLDNYKDLQSWSPLHQMAFYRMPEFIPGTMLANYQIDLAQDGLHPGIRSNQLLADAIAQHLSQA